MPLKKIGKQLRRSAKDVVSEARRAGSRTVRESKRAGRHALREYGRINQQFNERWEKTTGTPAWVPAAALAAYSAWNMYEAWDLASRVSRAKDLVGRQAIETSRGHQSFLSYVGGRFPQSKAAEIAASHGITPGQLVVGMSPADLAYANRLNTAGRMAERMSRNLSTLQWAAKRGTQISAETYAAGVAAGGLATAARTGYEAGAARSEALAAAAAAESASRVPVGAFAQRTAATETEDTGTRRLGQARRIAGFGKRRGRPEGGGGTQFGLLAQNLG